jgi:hypothetical protein
MSSNLKFDKETLIKHRFWIGLGLFAPMWLVAWLVLWLSVSGAVEVKKTEYAKSVKDIETVKDPKTQFYVTPMTEKRDQLAGRKNVVWTEVRSTQWNYDRDWYFNDKTPQLKALIDAPFMTPIPDDNTRKIFATDVRQEYRETLYKPWRDTKRQEFYEMAGPMTLDFDSVIRMAPITENQKYSLTDEEIWLNAETVWTKWEILNVLRETIQDIAYFWPIKAEKEESLPKDVVARHRSRNRNWELDLLIKRGDNRQLFISKNSTIKNVNEGRRTLPLREIKIWVAQASATDPDKLSHGREFLIEGDPVPWNQAVAIGHDDVKIDSFGFVENLPIFASQVFTWGTSPIKQIDAIELGYQSSRTAFQPLVAAKWTSTGLVKAEEEAAPSSTSTTTTTTTGTGGGMMGAAGGAGGAAVPTATAAGKNTSPLGINPKRYIQVTPQVRRIPVGIVVAIDQAYIEDLMSHFVNCRLRFQPTQVQWQQDTRGIKPPGESGKAEAGPEMVGVQKGGLPGGMPGGGPGGPGGSPMGMMQGMQDRMSGMMKGNLGQQSGMGMMLGMQNQQSRMMGRQGGAMAPNMEQPGAGGPNQTQPATAEESDPNIVEFGLYGIISLYDKVVQPAQQGTTPGAAPATTPAPGTTPATPTTPAPGTPPATQPETAPKAGDQPKTDAAPKVDAPKDEEKAAPKADEKKTDAPPKAEDKKNGENKGN